MTHDPCQRFALFKWLTTVCNVRKISYFFDCSKRWSPVATASWFTDWNPRCLLSHIFASFKESMWKNRIRNCCCKNIAKIRLVFKEIFSLQQLAKCETMWKCEKKTLLTIITARKQQLKRKPDLSGIEYLNQLTVLWYLRASKKKKLV